MNYDGDLAPDPRRWLAHDEHERCDAIRRHHRHVGPWHPVPERDEAHCHIHLVIENQVALGIPPEVADTIARLVAEGLGRHEAVHAVANCFAGFLVAVMQDGVPFDATGYKVKLLALNAARWEARRGGASERVLSGQVRRSHLPPRSGRQRRRHQGPR